MKCPHCNYEDYDDEGEPSKEGEFFSLGSDAHLERTIGRWPNEYKQYRQLFGCPSCDKVFTD